MRFGYEYDDFHILDDSESRLSRSNQPLDGRAPPLARFTLVK